MYQRKYISLRRKCDELQQVNERLVNRLYYLKKVTKQYRRQRRQLMYELDQLGDDYRNAQVPVFCEEGRIYDAFVPKREPAIEAKRQPVISVQKEVDLAAAASRLVPPRQSQQSQLAKMGFNMFRKHRSGELATEFFEESEREITATELTKSLALEWNHLSKEKKLVYYELQQLEGDERSNDDDT